MFRCGVRRQAERRNRTGQRPKFNEQGRPASGRLRPSDAVSCAAGISVSIAFRGNRRMGDDAARRGPGLQVEFQGPFAWVGTDDVPCLFESIAPETAGIYLWTVARPDGHLVFYVGETGRCVRTRMAEHYAEHAAGKYTLYEPARFGQGEKSCIWPGYDGRHGEDLGKRVGASIALAPEIATISRMMRFFVAPFPVDGDRRTRRRIEAAIADALYAAPGQIGAFQDTGVRYQRRREDEAPIEMHIAVGRGACVLGLPASVVA